MKTTQIEKENEIMIKVLRPTFTSITIETERGEVTLTVGDSIKFCDLKTGEEKTGMLETISKVTGGKGDKPAKFSITYTPNGESHTETWKSINIADGTLDLNEE
jgi:hypothetical protein